MTDEHEALNSQQVRRFVEAFRQALIQFRRKHYELGGFLARVREERIFMSWPRANAPHGERGYPTWISFCEPETGYAPRTCEQLALNYTSLREFELDENGLMFSQCMRIGWSKLGVVMRHVNGPNNRYRGGEDRLEIALTAAENMPEARLRAHLAGMRREHAIDEAREAAGDPTLAPEEVGNPNAPLAPNNPAGYVPYQIRFDNNQSLETFTRAVELIRERYAQELGYGRCVSMMALFYLSNHARDHEGGATLDVESMLRLFEDAYGLKFKLDTPAPRVTKKVARRRQQREAR